MKFQNSIRIILIVFSLSLSKIQNAQESANLPNFIISPYLNEQIITFYFNDEIRIHINTPSPESFDTNRPVGLVIFALPNGNTIEQTVGKVIKEGTDWHYDIQNIGAQTRFLRKKIKDYNLIVVYLEASSKSWPYWKSHHENYIEIAKSILDYLMDCFEKFNPFIILTGHSGGGRFVFSCLDAYPEIPNNIKRICFLDSDYGYNHSYGDKLINWLNSSEDHFLSVLAYEDSLVLYNGKRIVSDTGGTWFRSRIMQRYFSKYFTFTTLDNVEFIKHFALNNRIEILLKKNPNGEILHTIQVERNGFIHTILSG
ncbi:MAG: hypothetical protein JXA68_01525, partial [Ignavibacteriales bacterium]|nr:hypothetical protein [Ignavibacteriales bacterium]